jgi:hypothetical protein
MEEGGRFLGFADQRMVIIEVPSFVGEYRRSGFEQQAGCCDQRQHHGAVLRL